MYVNKSLIGKYVNNNKEYRESYKFLKGSRFLSKFFGKIKIKRTRAKYRFKSKKKSPGHSAQKDFREKK